MLGALEEEDLQPTRTQLSLQNKARLSRKTDANKAGVLSENCISVTITNDRDKRSMQFEFDPIQTPASLFYNTLLLCFDCGLKEPKLLIDSEFLRPVLVVLSLPSREVTYNDIQHQGRYLLRYVPPNDCLFGMGTGVIQTHIDNYDAKNKKLIKQVRSHFPQYIRISPAEQALAKDLSHTSHLVEQEF